MEKRIRGLDRERQNSRVMRLLGYTVEDDPKIKESDNLKSHKNPDHRINGVIYDSYAPTLKSFTDGDKVPKLTPFDMLKAQERMKVVENLDYFDVYGDIDDYFSDGGVKDLFKLCAEASINGMMVKVKEGQTRNILLHIQDLPSLAFKGGYSAVVELLRKNLADNEALENVFVLHPKAGYVRGEDVQGGGERWSLLPDTHIQVVHVKEFK